MSISGEDEPVGIRANILKVECDEEKYCIEIIKEYGDIFKFDETYKNIRGFFGGYVNAKE